MSVSHTAVEELEYYVSRLLYETFLGNELLSDP